MKTINQILFGMAVGVGLGMGLMAGTASAQRCFDVYDPERATLLATQATARSTGALMENLKMSDKKDEIKLWEKRRRFKNDDDEDSEDGEGGSSGGSEKLFPDGVYYDYMKGAAATGSEEHLPVQSNAADQEKYVREHFF